MAGAACPLFGFRTERRSLRLILRWVWQRSIVLEDLPEIAAIDPNVAGGAADEMLGLVRGRLAG
jgi:hypothetical protein